ncbi:MULTISPECIES: hypothetical protein [Catenuloplanes]|uniref:Uncharacterized protein n=1 Tax=Catenuloplanes niger TaxID=587534 RepID=A0AAE3ZJM1_9ACTN|nr:hypothetical protein [Catenuloplanes niger]MDR7319869.1 hypothetical protein [Catenuloplanes niger]
MAGTGTLDPFTSLCPDGRLIPLHNGVFFHPYPMGTPVNGIALQHAMNAGRDADGPAFFMEHEALEDVAALGTIQRVLRDLLDGLGTGARITTVAPPRAAEAMATWLRVADMTGVPVSVLGAPPLETSARVLAVGDTLRVLPKGLAAMRAVLGTAAELAADGATPAWTRLERLVERVAEAREELRVPGSAAGTELWRAGYQLAAGLVLGAPVTRDPAALAEAAQPMPVADMMRLFGRAPGERVTDPAALASTLLTTPGGLALVHTPDAAGRPAQLRWLVSHDGRLWAVDLAGDPADALTPFDPDDPGHAAMVTGGTTTVHVIAPPPPAAPPAPDSFFDRPTSLVDALIDAPLGRRAAGMLPTRPAPAPAPEGSVTSGASGPEELIRAQLQAVATGSATTTPEQHFDVIDDLLGNRLPPIRKRFQDAWDAADAAVRAADAAIGAHDSRTAELDRRVPVLQARVEEAGRRATAATDAHAQARQRLGTLRTRLPQAIATRGAAQRAAREAAQRAAPGSAPAGHGQHARAAAAAARIVDDITDEIESLEERLPELSTAEQDAVAHAAGLRDELAALTAEQHRIPGLRDLDVQRRDTAAADRSRAAADRDVVDAHLTRFRAQAADWATLEIDDLRRLIGRMDATDADDSAVRRAYDDAVTAVGEIFDGAATLTPGQVARLAYLAYLDGYRRDTENTHETGASKLRDGYARHVSRLSGYLASPVPDDEPGALAARRADLDLWNALAARFDEVQAGADQARADALRLADDEVARAAGAGEVPDLSGVAARAMNVGDRLAGLLWHGDSAPARALRADLGRTAGEVETLRARIELATAPPASWSLRDRNVLGDSHVREVAATPPAEIQALRTKIEPHVGESPLPWRSTGTRLESWLRDHLTPRSAAHWERLIDAGVSEDFNGRHVRIFVQTRNERYQQRTDKPAEGFLELQLRLAEQGFTRSVGGARSWNLPLGLTFVMSVANETMQALIGPITRFFMGGARRWAQATSTRVGADNFGFASDWGMLRYGADARVVVEVDGVTVATHDLNDHLVVLVSELFSSERDAVDPTTVGEPTPVRNPAALHEVDHTVNAVDFEDPLIALRDKLRTEPGFELDAARAARLVDRFREQMLNPRRAKEQNQWWSSNSWVSPHVSMSAGRGRHIDGHLRAGGQLIDLRRLTTTADAMIRNDMVGTTIQMSGKGASSQAGRRVGFEWPLSFGDHLVLPRWDVGFLTTSREVDRTSTVESLARNTYTRKDKLVRYVATVAADLTLDSNLGQVSVRRNTLIELAVPESHVAAFEERIMATPVLREAFSLPKDSVVRPAGTPAARAFPRKGAATPYDLRALAEDRVLEFVLPEGYVRDGRWAWAENHRNVRFSAPGDNYAGVEDVPDVRYTVDPAAPAPVIGATVFTKGTVFAAGDANGRPEVVSAEYVRNPAYRPTATTAPNGRTAAAEPWDARGVRDATDLFMLVKKGPIELAVEGRAAPLGSVAELPRSLRLLALLHADIHLRGDGQTGPASPATYRYLINDRGMVTAAIPVGADGATGRPVPNPALHLPTPPTRQVPEDRALASVQAFLDRLSNHSYAQMQLAEGVPAAIRTLLEHDPAVELIDRTGNRLPGQTLPPSAPVAAADGTIPPIPAGVRRHVVAADGWVTGDLEPLSGPTREPWALAARGGLGPGTMREMPGAELIFPDVLLLVSQQMKAVGRKLRKGARQARFFELALKFGVPGMRAKQRTLFDGGITDVYTVGKYTFHVNLTAVFDELRSSRTVPDFLVDTRGVGRSTDAIREALARRFGTRVDFAGRLSVKDFFGIRVKLADLQVMWERENANAVALAQAASRRRKVNGDATEFGYGVNYQLTVAVTDRKGNLVKPVSSRSYSGKDFWAPVRVGAEDLAPAPGSPHRQADLIPKNEALTRLTATEADAVQRWLAGESPASLVSGVDEGTAGMYVWLNRVGMLAEAMQRFVDGVDGGRTPAPTELDTMLRDLAPGASRIGLESGIAEGITPDFLEPHADKLMTRTGFVVPLGRRDGAVRQLRLHLVPANPRFTQPTDTASQRDYGEVGGEAGATAMRGYTLQATAGPGGIFQFGSGSGAAPGADSAQGSNYAPQTGAAAEQPVPAASRGADHVNVAVDVTGARQRSTVTGTRVGGREASRALYKGRSYSHSADAILVVSYERFSGGTMQRSRFDLKLAHGLEMSTPHVLAKSLGLPIPARDERDMPPATSVLVPVDRELAFAAAPVEKVTAYVTRQETVGGESRTVRKDVLATVRDNLRAMKVNVDDPDIMNALEHTFRTSSVRNHYRAVRRDGLHLMITINRALGGVRRIGVRLTAVEGPLEYVRPRPDVKGTISGISIGQRSRTEALGYSAKIGVAGDAKFNAGTLRMGVGTGADAEVGRKNVDAANDTDLFVQRVSPADLDSQEFSARARFRLEFFEASDQPQVLSSFADGGAWLGKVMDSVSDGRLRTVFQGMFPAAKPPVRTSELTGQVHLLPPTHVTKDRAAPGTSPLAGVETVPETIADLPEPTVRVLDGETLGAALAALRPDLDLTRRLAADLQGLEVFNVGKFAEWLPAARQPGAERYDTGRPMPHVPGYGHLSTASTAVQTALHSENVAPNMHRLMTGEYVIKGHSGDEFTVRAVLRNGRWLDRGGYVKTNVPLTVADRVRQRETRRAAGVRPVEIDMGPREGDAKLVGSTNPALGAAAAQGGASAYTGLSIDVDKHASDYDYFRFDLTLIGTSRNGRSWVRSDIPFGLLARVPSAKAAEIFRPGTESLDIVDHALTVALGDVATPVGGRRFLAGQLAERPATAAPNLLRPEELEAAVERVRAFTAATQVAPTPAGAAEPTMLPEDCVVRAFGAFVAVHRRTANAVTDLEGAGVRGADDLARSLGGRFVPVGDADTLWKYVANRPGSMLAVRSPAESAGMSHLFWAMSVGGGEMRWLDGQRHGASDAPATIGTMRQSLRGEITGRHARLFRQPGTDVLLLDESGRTVDLAEALPPRALGGADPGEQVGRRAAGRLHQPATRTPSTGGTGLGDGLFADPPPLKEKLFGDLSGIGRGPVADLTGPRDRPAAAAPQAPPPLVAPDREIRTLGAFASRHALRALETVTGAARGVDGPPVILIDLSGSAETALEAVRRLDRTLRNAAWRGTVPIVAATMGTRVSEDAFALVRQARRPVTVQQRPTPRQFGQEWQLIAPGSESVVTAAETPTVELFRTAGTLVAAPSGTLTPELAAWIDTPDWAAAEAYHRRHAAALHTPAVAAELDRVITENPDDVRLSGLRSALRVAERFGGVGETRLTPYATSFLAVEPAYDAALRGPVPATFVYDYLAGAGRSRGDRFAMDGVLLQLMLAGQLPGDEALALAGAAAANRLDRANRTVLEMVAAVRALSPGDLRTEADVSAWAREFESRARGVASTERGALPQDCLDPVDRTAWVGRLDALRDRLRAHPDPVERYRAEIIDTITYALSNC